MIQRNLDGVYFRMKRGDKYMNVCFSDMTEDEQDEVLKGRNEEYLRNFVKILAKDDSQDWRRVGYCWGVKGFKQSPKTNK